MIPISFVLRYILDIYLKFPIILIYLKFPTILKMNHLCQTLFYKNELAI